MQNNNHMTQLKTKGYIVFRNVLKNPMNAVQYIRDQYVNYTKMNGFVEDHLLGTVNEILGVHLKHIKYKVSDLSSSTDAGKYIEYLRLFECGDGIWISST